MKEFKWSLKHSDGEVAGETMTVGELMEALSEYPADMPIFASWEGVNAFVCKENFSREIVKSQDEECECLIIDVNKYF